MINKNLSVIARVPVNQIICILWFRINFWKTRIFFLVKLTFQSNMKAPKFLVLNY